MSRTLPPSRRAVNRVLLVPALIAIALAGLLVTQRLTAAVTFTPGNVALLVANGTGSNVTGSIVEIITSSAGSAIQTIALPDTTNVTDSYRMSASATSTGYVSLSNDRTLLTVTGHNSTNTVPNANTLQINKGVYTVNSAGAVVKQTTYNGTGTNQARGATSLDNSTWYIGDQGGFYSNGTSSASPSGNIRSVKSFGGTVYAFTASTSLAPVGIISAPTGGTYAGLAGLAVGNAAMQDFYLVQSGDHGATYDMLYVLNATGNTAGTILKYSLVDTNGNTVLGDAGDLWTTNGSYVTTFGGFGLTAADAGAGEVLYLSTGQGALAANSVVKVADAAGYNLAISVTTANNVTLYTAAAGTVIKGLDFVPVSGPPTTPTVTLTLNTNSATETGQTVVRATATASAPVTGDQTVSLAVVGTGITASDYTLSSTTITIPGGATSGFVTFAVVDDALFEGPETATLTISNPSAGITVVSPASQNIAIADNDVAPPACSVPPTHLISAIQGIDNSPAITGPVSVRGVVVGDYEGPSPALRGFFLQDLNPDGNPATSEGIFVFESNGANSVSLGQVVQVAGAAADFQDQTQITASGIESCGTTASAVPEDVMLPVPAPVGGVPYLERFEGMLVRFHQTLFVTEHFQLSRFGQVVMSSGGRLPQPTNIVLPGSAAQGQQAANNLNRIVVDDESQTEDPDPIRFARGGNPLSASNTLRGGDSATGMVGVMTYGWAGNAASPNAYRLRPIGALGGAVPNFQAANPRPTTSPGVGGRLKVASFNVLNYFLTLDVGTQANCGPIGFKQECRGAEVLQNQAPDLELVRQQQKLNAALLKLDGDVVGFMELENTENGLGQDVNPLLDIVNRLNSSLGGTPYSYVDTGVVGTDTIRVGMIYKNAKVTPVGAPLVDTAAVHNRPPMAQLFAETATSERFTVIVNHFKSKGTPCGTGSDADLGDGQGCWNALRVQQASALLSFISGTVVPTAGDPDVVLLGDFNAYAKEDPIRTLETGGFTNLVSRFSGADAYSYAFDGQWGYLDQGLASASLLPQVTGARDYHINADEPSALDYNTNFKSNPGQITSLFNGDEYRTSDHDPVVIGLALLQAAPDSYSFEAGSPLSVNAVQGILANDSAGAAILDHTDPSHGTLALNADGSFTYTPEPGFVGTDSFTYTVNGATPSYAVQLFSTKLPSLATVGGVALTAGGFGSAVSPVPGVADEFYGLTDRGPNVDGPGGTTIEPLPNFVPEIGRFKVVGGEAVLQQVITLKAADGTPFSGRANTQVSGEVITDLNGTVLPADPNGFDPEGLVALADGTFWVSDEYGPFLSHFDATGLEIERLSPFSPIPPALPAELANRVANRGMEGLTITPDGSMLVGLMQSALQQSDLVSPSIDAKDLTPVRIVTYRLADGATSEYLYLLDNPKSNDTSVSEITALSNTTFLADERDGDYPPGAYTKLYKIDIGGATDVGPNSSVGGAVYDGAGGGLLIGGKTIENLLRNGSTPQNTATSTATLAGAGIAPVTKSLYFDVGALLTNIDSQGRFFSHDKIEGVAVFGGGATLLISNDSDFGIDDITNATPPFQLHAKATPAGVQDDGEYLVLGLVRTTTTVTIDVVDTIEPETTLDSWPSNPNNSAMAGFTFSGTDAGAGVDGFECAIDGGPTPVFVACSSPASYPGLADGSHTFDVRAVDKEGHKDSSPASYTWTIDTAAPDTMIDSGPGSPTSSTTASFTFHGTDLGTGVARLECAIDSGSFGVCVSGVSYPGLAIGNHTFDVRAVDAAGNVDTSPAHHAWTVGKATAAVTLSNLTQTYTASPLTPTATTVPPGLTIVWTNAPQAGAGSYLVSATVNDANYQGAASGTFVIEKAPATVTLSNLTQTHTGGLLTPTAATAPPGLAIVWTNAPQIGPGSFPVTATVNDLNYQGAGNGTFVISPVASSLSVTLQSPNGGEQLLRGAPFSIQWTGTGAGSPNPSSFDVALSLNGGGTFSYIPGCTNLNGALRTCAWTPAATASNARIRVTARGSGGATVADASNASFTIVAPSIRIIFPTGSSSWAIGTPQTLQWDHNLGPTSFVKIELSRNGGGSWQTLSASVQNSSATGGTFNWVVTGPPTNSARLRVSWLAGPVSDISNGQFSIVSPAIEVKSPDGNDSWRIGDTRNIRFTDNLGAGQSVNIEVSRDGGATWGPVTTVSTSSAGSVVYPWLVTGPPTTSARIRARWASNPAVGDTSTGAFTILARITVTAPNTNVSWNRASTRAITWEGNLGAAAHVNIELTRNGGGTWEPVASNVLNTGTFNWVVTGPVTTNARIRVTWTSDATVQDLSDVSFRIR